jgi:hypothetical protein
MPRVRLQKKFTVRGMHQLSKQWLCITRPTRIHLARSSSCFFVRIASVLEWTGIADTSSIHVSTVLCCCTTVSFTSVPTCYVKVGLEVIRPVVIKSSVFWDITPCNPLKVSRAVATTCVMLFSCLVYSSSLNWRRYVHPKRRLTCSGLYSDISQKTERFTLCVYWPTFLILKKDRSVGYWQITVNYGWPSLA